MSVKLLRAVTYLIIIQLCSSAKVFSGFILNGVDIGINTYPFLARITNEGYNHCGGVIIGLRTILTAAHCLNVPIQYLHVYLGGSDNFSGKKYEVCKIVPHEKYQGQLEFDVGLLLLRNKISFNRRTVRMAKLAPNRNWQDPRHYLVVAGYGQQSNMGNPLGVNYRHLRVTRMMFVSKKTCERSQSEGLNGMPIPDSVFCMIGQNWNSDCEGDSGSAVVWEDYVVGIVNAGRYAFCGSAMMSSMYADLWFYKSWIKKQIQNLELRGCAANKPSYQPEEDLKNMEDGPVSNSTYHLNNL